MCIQSMHCMSDAYLAEELGQEYSSYDERDILKFGG